MVIARAADVAMHDRLVVGSAGLGGLAIEIVVEDRFDRAVCLGADLSSAGTGGLDTSGAEGLGQPDDA